MEVYSGALPKLHAQSECRCPASHPRVHPLVERYRTTLTEILLYRVLLQSPASTLQFIFTESANFPCPYRAPSLYKGNYCFWNQVADGVHTSKIRQQQQTVILIDGSEGVRTLTAIQNLSRNPGCEHSTHHPFHQIIQHGLSQKKEPTDVLFDMGQNTIKLMMIHVNV